MKSSTMPERLRVLVDAYCTDSIEASDLRELEALLSDDAEARRYLSAYCRMHAELFFSVEAAHAVQAVRAPVSLPTPAPSDTSILGSVWSGTVGYFSQTGPLSYLVATVLFAVGMWFGSQITISRSMDRTGQGRTVQADRPPASSAVARITALADCKWSKQGSGVRGQGSGISKTQDLRPKTVFLGDRFRVSSGLMEITYDSGAKVILQGPCTYEIDSDRSGFLAVGRLAARVEKGSGIRGQGSGKTHSSAFSLQPSALFAVRTPTAIVTDLGTEFGVEVEKSGATRSHVFQGKVKLVASGQWSMVSDENTIYLTAGKSARVERGRNNKAAITREPSQPGRFVRSISKSPNHQIQSQIPLPTSNYQLPTLLPSHRPRHNRRSYEPRERHQRCRSRGGRGDDRQWHDACFPLCQRENERPKCPGRGQ